MKKLLAPLIAGLLVTGAFAQSPAAPSAATTGPSTVAQGEGTKANVAKTTPKAKHMKKMKHGAKSADTAAK
ncbi:hypothetical protein GT347_04205 [Xylophilus rhododendri]|uniref:Pentapeptide MXKDX repeat protein n=1 Tax=Xylophilus rhododendri TaxID=2697032 RepID=A0A857J2G7_9BURK|nr:hypothetical protein [Xylophilus rhododendri]QHI97251.1 hypothetical protein GT347_04205 [Xylophilus rhododendri]